jgi:hypothetical protein
MAEEITIAGLAQMTRKAYKEIAKKVSVWNKADGLIIFDDYKVEGKTKMPIGIPFRKKTEMEAAYKEVKAKKTHKLAKVAACLLTLGADGISATLELKRGGLKPENIKAAALDVFSALGITNINITGESEDAKEAGADVDNEGVVAAVAPTPDKLKSDAVALAKAIFAESKPFTEVVARIKSNTVDAKDLESVQALSDKIKQLADMMAQLGKSVDEKTRADYDKINTTFAPQVQQVLAKLQSNNPKTPAKKGESQLAQVLSSARQQVEKTKVEIEKMDKTLDKLPSSFLPSGKSILSAVGL